MINLTVTNPVFASYAFYATILVVKLLIMAPVTAYFRLKTKTFASPEDVSIMKHSKVKATNEEVERVRRAHLNDLENIPAFWIVGFLYVLTEPSIFMAMMCFRTFALARICHSIAYIGLKFTPLRALCFITGMLINIYMAICVLLNMF